MLLAMETYLRQGQRQLRRLALDPRVQLGVRTAAYGTGGLLLSAASLGNFAQPLAMGAVCGVTGWRALVMGLGAVLGYWVFWGMAGVQAMVWAALGTLLALFGGKRKEIEEMPLLLPAAAALAIAVTGLLFQILWQEDTPLRVYLLRIGVAALSTLLARLGVYFAVLRIPRIFGPVFSVRRKNPPRACADVLRQNSKIHTQPGTLKSSKNGQGIVR